jgi:hypothetical protein
MASGKRSLLLGSVAVTIAIVAVACGGKSTGNAGGAGAGSSTTTAGHGGHGTSSGASGTAGAGGLQLTTGTGGGPTGPFDDFPASPIVDASAPMNAPALFGAAVDPTGGPCLYEPEPDTLYPNNWLRPRFSWTPAPGQNLFQLRLHTSAEVHDLVVYTANDSWTMPKDMWAALTSDAVGVPITLTITGGTYGGGMLGQPSVGSSHAMTIAPVDAPGAIVYWTIAGTTAFLKGFSPGDETVVAALQPSQVQMPTAGGGHVTCIGCHTSTPDGSFAGFTAQGPWGNALASIQGASPGAQPAFLGAGALATLTAQSPLGIQTYSKAHWSDGDHVMVAPWGDSPNNQLAWIDLEAQTSGQGTSYGFLARTGDANDVGAPTFSHDGSTIVYVSTNTEFTGRLDEGFGHLYAVPYNDRQGGTAAPVPGDGSDPSYNQYYPAFSPDDAFLAFNRIPVGGKMYDADAAEVLVMPATGGTATRLAANDPPACTGLTSPGVTNSWPKWAPQASTLGGKTYYWLIFSSKRDPSDNPQLYITGVVVDGGSVETHGALYLWNQPGDENNHTPAWDYFMIPPPPTM